MTIINGHIRNGQIVPDEPVELPEGAPVEVYVGAKTSSETPSFADRYERYIGAVDDLPSDSSTTYRERIYGDPHNQRRREDE